MQNDSTVENNMAAITTTGRTAMNLPIIPTTNNKGENARMVVTEDANTGRATWEVPDDAASVGGSPAATRLLNPSAMTIASSTIIPVTMINPKRVIMFRVCPVRCMTIREPAKDTGIPRAT